MGIYSEHIFPSIMDFVMRGEAHAEVRRDLLKDVRGSVLEIGFGTGLNAAHYPKQVHRVTTVEVNEGMGRLAERRVSESQITVEPVIISGARGESLPMEDATFDSIVSTWTLCSIDDVAGALGELNRILKKGGRLFFIEHGASPEAKVRRLQDILNPLQKVIGCGCNLNRDISGLITEGGFVFDELEKYYMEGYPKILSYTYKGVAGKK